MLNSWIKIILSKKAKTKKKEIIYYSLSPSTRFMSLAVRT